jgi:hypothetical protein
MCYLFSESYVMDTSSNMLDYDASILYFIIEGQIDGHGRHIIYNYISETLSELLMVHSLNIQLYHITILH